MPEPDVLAHSARGATYLIIVQILSRGLAFAVNQILLRFLSPELLGIAARLDLFAVSALFFARESLRVALQRSSNNILDGKGGKGQLGAAEQAAVNLSYVAVALGPPLAAIFAWLTARGADARVEAVPFWHESLLWYAAACLIELASEPAFAVVQQQLQFGVRARAETAATLARCFIVCGVAVWGSRQGRDLGALPFAGGQMGYALALNAMYYGSLWKHISGFSLWPRPLRIGSEKERYLPSAALTLALNFYAQAGLKHVLTQGDALLTTLFTSLSSQGIYALASSYGSLLARLVFQPIEESSRGGFGRLVSTKPTQKDLEAARSFLVTLLHAYALLSIMIVTVGPTLAPLLLRYVAGRAWAQTEAPEVLAQYCFYIPFLAFNGVLEAFVSAVATPEQLHRQSAWMLAFSAGFAGAGFLFLKVYDWGAAGLVAANAVSMATRILWSRSLVSQFFAERRMALSWHQILPGPFVFTSSVGTMAMLWHLRQGFDGNFRDLIAAALWSAVYGAVAYADFPGLPGNS